MTLFGSKKKNDNHTRGVTDSAVDGFNNPPGHTILADRPSQLPASTFGQTQVSGPGSNHDGLTGPGQHGDERRRAQDDPYSTSGVGTIYPDERRDIPPAGDVKHGTAHARTRTSSHGSGGRLVGKIESTIGSIVGSDTLKAKGLRRENEANSVKIQRRELDEADRLEREAMRRRERTVAHGADPANAALGAGNPGLGSEHREL
ncbi:hypothetical protein BDN70DRAFT_994572 [Pholiota conissans]|uniref:Uncharacterized protein n=1 Tax=Pholiota conissans TaxID=109636 RepID=A0A9P6CT14_9AGAR|nr:hypothetical protein BDN70DRAFT_994572 [Pholiota conissans]